MSSKTISFAVPEEQVELIEEVVKVIRIKYLAACGGVRNTVSGPGPSLGFDTNRGPTKWGFITSKNSRAYRSLL